MKIQILSYDDCSRLYQKEVALKQDKQRYSYVRWSKERLVLLDKLGQYGAADPTECGDGDYFIGEDWFETGVLHVAIMKWEVFTCDLIQECYNVIDYDKKDDLLITIGKSMPMVEDMFDLVITRKRSYISFFKKSALQTRNIITSDEHYAGVRPFLS